MLDLLETYSYLGLFAIIFLEEAGIPLPVPGDLFIGLASGLKNSNYFLIIAVVISATISGSTILFTISKKIGRPVAEKYGKFAKITPARLRGAEKWFNKHGGFAIVIARLIPGLRIVTPIVAGILGISYKTFWLYTIIAAFIWANIYFLAGKVLGSFFYLLIQK